MDAEIWFDLGFDCGWCLVWDDGRVEHGVEYFSRLPNDRVIFRAFRLFMLAKKKEVEATGGKLRSMGFEYIDFVPKKERRHWGLHAYGGMRALLLAFCETHDIADRPINWDVVKLHMTGIRNAAKDLVTQRVRKIVGDKNLDHNRADAIAVKWTAHNEHRHRNVDRASDAKSDNSVGAN